MGESLSPAKIQVEEITHGINNKSKALLGSILEAIYHRHHGKQSSLDASFPTRVNSSYNKSISVTSRSPLGDKTVTSYYTQKVEGMAFARDIYNPHIVSNIYF